jgi:solute carrier family 41
MSSIIAALFLATIPLWVYIAWKEVHTKKILIHGWFPVVSAMIISRWVRQVYRA